MTHTWTDIIAAQTDKKSPVDSILMGAIRGNLDYLYDHNQITLINLSGAQYQNSTTPIFRLDANYLSQAQNSTKTLFDTAKIHVPDDHLNISVAIYAACSRTNADSYIRVALGATNFDFASLPGLGSIAWQTVVTHEVAASGNLDLSAVSFTSSTATPNFYLRGILIYCTPP